MDTILVVMHYVLNNSFNLNEYYRRISLDVIWRYRSARNCSLAAEFCCSPNKRGCESMRLKAKEQTGKIENVGTFGVIE